MNNDDIRRAHVRFRIRLDNRRAPSTEETDTMTQEELLQDIRVLMDRTSNIRHALGNGSFADKCLEFEPTWSDGKPMRMALVKMETHPLFKDHEGRLTNPVGPSEHHDALPDGWKVIVTLDQGGGLQRSATDETTLLALASIRKRLEGDLDALRRFLIEQSAKR